MDSICQTTDKNGKKTKRFFGELPAKLTGSVNLSNLGKVGWRASEITPDKNGDINKAHRSSDFSWTLKLWYGKRSYALKLSCN